MWPSVLSYDTDIGIKIKVNVNANSEAFKEATKTIAKPPAKIQAPFPIQVFGQVQKNKLSPYPG
jgi:uncharacterized protein YpuA (DUF1002 family)